MILLVLVALVARVDAAPGDDSIAQAVRYAKVLTGVDDPDDRIAAGADDAGTAYDETEADETEADETEAEADNAGEAADAGEPGPDAVALANAADREVPDPGDPEAEDPEAGDPDAGDPEAEDPEARLRLAYDAAGDGDPTGDGDAGDAADRDAGQVAMLDAEQAPAGAATDDASLAASPAGASETYEAWMRHPRPSRWGRLDLGLAWRRRWSEPMHEPPHRLDEVWLVATWRR